MDTEGRSIHKRLFVPNGAFQLEGETIQQAYDRERDRNLAQVVKLLREFVGEAVGELQAEDYRSFMSKAIVMLAPYKGQKVNLKVVPDNKEKRYPDLPNREYVEKHVPGTPSKLWLSKREVEEIQKMSSASTASSGSEMPPV